MAVPSGTVNVVDTISGSTLASGALDAAGNATLTWMAVAGTYNLVAKYPGDSNFDPGTSTAVPYTVTAVLVPVTVTFTTTPSSPQPAGTSVAMAVGVASA